MIGFGCVSCRILWVKFKFSMVKVCMVMVYGPEGEFRERERFWNDLQRVVHSVGNGYRLCVLDLNGWVEDRVRVGITDGFGVSGENSNGRRVINFCAENGLSVSNTYFEDMNLHKYIRVAKMEWR